MSPVSEQCWKQGAVPGVSVVVIGLNHRTVPLELLERMTVSHDRLEKSLHDLVGRPNISEAVLLSTCNRTEVYVLAERFHGAWQDVRSFLSELAHLAPEEFSHHLYSHYDDGAVQHLFSVAAGLDSAVLGESEILGQVREAWEQGQRAGTVRSAMNHLFRQALQVGKRSRTETGIGRHVTSVSQAAVAMASDRLGSLDGVRVLVLGAGGMGEGMAVALAGAGVAEVRVANRTPERAQALAERVRGRAVPMAEVSAGLAEVDVLLSSTAAESVVLTTDDIEHVMAQRQGRRLLVVDVAVPRDIDSGVGQIPGVTLLDLDDIRAFAAVGAAGRRAEVVAVEAIVAEEVDRYLEEVTARTAAPLVAALWQRAEELRQAELDRHKSRIDALDDKGRTVVDSITKGLLAKLLHEPTVQLKEAAGTPRAERLSDSLRDLFDL
ncbi:MAG: glutamyl-tRNA reductase [Acidimicrobiia bacterium]|nr:glutamyl-tRNA reductase [Acidimicrobiia bacterium]